MSRSNYNDKENRWIQVSKLGQYPFKSQRKFQTVTRCLFEFKKKKPLWCKTTKITTNVILSYQKKKIEEFTNTPASFSSVIFRIIFDNVAGGYITPPPPLQVGENFMLKIFIAHLIILFLNIRKTFFFCIFADNVSIYKALV